VKKLQNEVAGIRECSNLSVPQRKTRLKQKENVQLKQPNFFKFQNDLSENRSDKAVPSRQCQVVRKQKAKMCVARRKRAGVCGLNRRSQFGWL